MVNVVLAGGGTAGHTSPLIATANRLAELDPEGSRVAIGTPKGLESRVIPEAGLDLELISPVPMPRKPGLELAMVPMRLARAVGGAKEKLRKHRADVLVGFGGYVATPAYIAAKQLKLPVIVHEQNSVPGLANKVGARFAEGVYTAFPNTALKGAECIGLPVRDEITLLDRAAEQTKCRELFELNPDLPVLLVSGGSQGARSINEAVIDAMDPLLAAGVQILHVLGAKNFTDEMVSVADSDTGAIYRPVAYVNRMEQAYAAADLMLARSGAGTVVETAVVGLPAIFVPLPHGNGEQARNAEALVHAGGGRLIADSALSSTWLAGEIPGIIKDTAGLQTMGAIGRGLVSGEAATALAERVLAAARS